MRRSSLIISGVFHLVLLIVAATGLPLWAKREFIVPKPVTVDFIDIAKVTETNNVTPEPVQPEKEKEPKEAEKKPPAPALNTSQQVQTPTPEKIKPPEKKETKKETKAEEIDPNAPPDKSKKPKKKEEAKAEPKKDFSSVLKNLADQSDSKSDTPADNKTATPAPGQNAPLGAKMTMSEEDALRRQLEKCWNVPFGAKDVESTVVEIFMVINPDRTLREARVVDTARYNTDSFYRAVADSALRAVRSSLCSPFDVPPEKYDTWNTVTVTFNPKDMF